MRFDDTLGRVATSRYTARLALVALTVGLVALAADPAAAESATADCLCEHHPDLPECQDARLA